MQRGKNYSIFVYFYVSSFIFHPWFFYLLIIIIILVPPGSKDPGG